MLLRNLFEVKMPSADAAFAFGRFNPAHQGHIEVYKAVQAAGNKWFIGTNPSTHGPNDPLTFEEKSAWMQAIYPPIKGHILPEQSVVTLASKLYEMLGDNKTIAYVTDGNDWAWAGKLLNDYNGKEGPHGYYKFRAIKHVESPRVSSATALRTAARANDEAAFYAASGTDPKLTVNGQTYFDTVVAAVGANPEKPKKVAKKKQPEVTEVAVSGDTIPTTEFVKGIYSLAAEHGSEAPNPEAVKKMMVLAPNQEVDVQKTFQKIIAAFQAQLPKIQQMMAELDALIKQAEGLNEFSLGGGSDDGDGDPYRYPKPQSYRRSADYFGQFEADHFDREDFDDDTGVFKGYWGRTQIAYFKFDNPRKTGSDDPGMGWYYEPESDGNDDTDANPAGDRSDKRKQQELGMIRAFLKSGKTPKPGSQIYSLMKRHGMAEGESKAMAQTARRLTDPKDGAVAKLRAAGDKRREDQLKGRDIAKRNESVDLKTSLQELSNDMLGKYKKAAGADAKKADAEGNVKRGDKRFSGIVKATNKQFANDTKKSK